MIVVDLCDSDLSDSSSIIDLCDSDSDLSGSSTPEELSDLSDSDSSSIIDLCDDLSGSSTPEEHSEEEEDSSTSTLGSDYWHFDVQDVDAALQPDQFADDDELETYSWIQEGDEVPAAFEAIDLDCVECRQFKAYFYTNFW